MQRGKSERDAILPELRRKNDFGGITVEEITITKQEAETLLDLFETNLLEIIREDTEIDGLEWLSNIMSIYDKCKKIQEKKG